MITFTGSVPVGMKLRDQAGLKRLTLELGSNSAVIVEPDCDLEFAVKRCIFGAFAYAGQVCISVQRIYVHESIADEFLTAYAKRPASSGSDLRSTRPLTSPQ